MILKIRNVFLSFLLLPVCWQAGSAAAAQPPAADLERLVAEALASNPEIKASEERWQMTVSRAAQAGSLDDPMLMFKIQNGLVRDPFDFNRDATTSKVIGLSQAVPAYGKRALLRKGRSVRPRPIAGASRNGGSNCGGWSRKPGTASHLSTASWKSSKRI